MKLFKTTPNFIAWTSTDEEGTFTHVGQLLSRKQGIVTMQLDDGSVINFPEDDGVIVPAEKPNNWGMQQPERRQQPAVSRPPQSPRAQRAPREGSKKQRALALYAAAEDKSKGTIVQLFMDELGMTPLGAQTYFYNIRRMGA